MKKKITYIISNIDKAVAFEWIAQYLSNEKFTLSFILLNPGPSHLHEYLSQHNFSVISIRYKGKRDLAGAILAARRFLLENKTDLVHCHLFDASLAGLIAARLAGIKQRIYTRHHSDYHHIYHPHAVKYDRWMNRLATQIVAVSGVVKNILVEKENVSPKKITVIHHGFELDKFATVDPARIHSLREKYALQNAAPVIGVVSRLTEWKGVQYTVPAFKQLLAAYPSAKLMCFNAQGDHEATIKDLLADIDPARYQLVPFEKDLFALYHLFDVFVHVPVRPQSEAFGQVYIESLAAGTPCVFTLSGVALDVVRDRHNALVVPYANSQAILEACTTILNNDELRKTLAHSAKISVQQNFSIHQMISKLESLYLG